MAKLDHLGFESAAEALAEKFHMDRRFLEALNPGVDFAMAGTKIVVIAGRGAEPIGAVARIEVDKKAATLRAFDDRGALLASFPATIGSGDFPSPSGAMEVRAVAPEPKYYFDPEGRNWGPDERLTIAAVPNNPVGGTWIDLTKEGYGIHGTPDPRLIGKTASHGCVRLTNWDAAALAKAVGRRLPGQLIAAAPGVAGSRSIACRVLPMFFADFNGLWRTIVVGACAYVMLVLLLRLTGKRTLSKMNAFDLVVTVALGSTLATILLSKDMPLAEGVAAFLLLAGLQFAVTWTSVRSVRFRGWIKADPRPLLRDGVMLDEALRSERVTRDEVEAAIRGAGYLGPEQIALVTLETDGSMSVVPQRRAEK